MGLDGQLKRYFPLVICALIAAVAYLQASGIGELVASTIVGSPGAELAGVAPGAIPKAKQPSAKPILARNPFDSATGPLDGTAYEMPDGGIANRAPEKSGEDPYEDPVCDFGRVILISADDDPEWSFAAIEDQSGTSILRRQGDDIDGHKVHYLSWDRIWLTGNTGRCQMRLGDKSKAKAPPSKAPRKPSGKRGRQLSPELAAKIQKVSDTEFTGARDVVDEILENQAQLMRSARIVPEKDGDKVVGIRMFGIRKGTLLQHLGFQNGDRLQAINDFELTDPQKALEAYGRLRTVDQLKVSIVRKNKPVTIDFNIR